MEVTPDPAEIAKRRRGALIRRRHRAKLEAKRRERWIARSVEAEPFEDGTDYDPLPVLSEDEARDVLNLIRSIRL